MTLDGELLGDNDGAHSSVEIIVQKALKAGLHPIEVRYFDCNGGVLQMELVNEKGEKEMQPFYFSASNLLDFNLNVPNSSYVACLCILIE